MAEEFVAIPMDAVNPAARQYLTRATDGRAAKALRLERESVLQELQATSAIRPVTIVNFNPVWLRTTSAIPYKVPPGNWKHQPEDMKVTVQHKGHTFVGSYMTITQPFLYPWPRGTRRDDGTGEDVLDCTIDHVLPLGIALDIWMTYNKSAELTMGMGGILIYEGDRRVMDHQPATLKFPVAKNLANGKRAYYSVDTPYQQALDQVFEQQRRYASYAVHQARGLHADENQRKDVTEESHRVWGHYALEHGWGVEALEDWMLANPEVNVARCEYCGDPRKQTKAMFCQKCNAPYDAYVAFMAGKAVPEQYLYGLQGKQLADVQREMKRRKALFADDTEIVEPKGRRGKKADATEAES